MTGKSLDAAISGSMERFDRPYKNCLSHWFPKILAAGLPVPRTEIVRTNLEMLAALDPPGLLPGEWSELQERMLAAIAALGGVPVFMRTGQTSGKHSWTETCYLSDITKLYQHVMSLVDFSGCHDLHTNVWVFRALIPTAPLFTAFGGMPITREFRLFADSERQRVHHLQPYWPPHAIEGYCKAEWRAPLARASAITQAETDELGAMALRAATAVGGDWSVDFLQDRDGHWWLTDMALACTSFKWDPAAPEEPAA